MRKVKKIFLLAAPIFLLTLFLLLWSQIGLQFALFYTTGSIGILSSALLFIDSRRFLLQTQRIDSLEHKLQQARTDIKSCLLDYQALTEQLEVEKVSKMSRIESLATVTENLLIEQSKLKSKSIEMFSNGVEIASLNKKVDKLEVKLNQQGDINRVNGAYKSAISLENHNR